MENRHLLCASLVLNALDIIENKTGKMAHDIDEISGYLDRYYTGDYKVHWFLNKLNQYIDYLSSQDKLNGETFNDYLENF